MPQCVTFLEWKGAEGPRADVCVPHPPQRSSDRELAERLGLAGQIGSRGTTRQCMGADEDIGWIEGGGAEGANRTVLTSSDISSSLWRLWDSPLVTAVAGPVDGVCSGAKSWEASGGMSARSWLDYRRFAPQALLAQIGGVPREEGFGARREAREWLARAVSASRAGDQAGSPTRSPLFLVASQPLRVYATAEPTLCFREV